MDLAALTAKFGKLYKAAAKANTKKQDQQKLLFQAFDESLGTYTLGRKVIKEDEIQGVPSDYVSLRHPGWRIVEQKENKYILEENPSLKKFTYVNVDDGMVYGRTVAEGAPSLDDERLKAEDPLLWERVTEWPESQFDLVSDAIHTFAIGKGIPDSTLSEWLEAFFRNRDIQRVIKDLSTLGDTDLVRVQEYIVPGSLAPRLVAPRKASLEELNDGNDHL